jgi:O-acetyl-ADP-ribose deacetylase (regulator of RNase III)
VKGVDKADLIRAGEELRSSWAHIEKEVKRATKKGKQVATKAAKKTVKVVSTSAKKVAKTVVPPAKKVAAKKTK